MISVILEALLLAIIGGLLGAIGAWIMFDGYTSATMNWQTFSQVAFAFLQPPDSRMTKSSPGEAAFRRASSLSRVGTASPRSYLA